jgi:hypothetical protein
MAKVRLETEIDATPEEVRAIVSRPTQQAIQRKTKFPQILDFARYPEWHNSFIQQISATSTNSEPQKLPQGEILNVKCNNLNLVPIITSNTATELSWYGSIFGGAFAGKHYFQFLESHTTPNGTTFVHGEDWDGWMTWMFGEGMLGFGRKNAVTMYEEFSQDVKKRAEELKKLKEGIAKTQNDPYSKI